VIKTIIIADDSATARMIIKRCFEIAGCAEATFLDAGDGEQALELAKTNQPDLLITDLNMPKMDGRSLLIHLKASPMLHGLPVIVITSANNEAKENELRGLGALAVLSKPITPPEVAKLLETIGTM